MMSFLLCCFAAGAVIGAAGGIFVELVMRIESVALHFKWFDLWIGLFIDRPNKTWYVCLVPTVVLKIKFRGDRR